MNLRFVEAFYWVATLKSVSRAAEKLFLTQSAMSARVAALEEELGVLLLDRRDKQFRLTVAGTRFVSYAQKLMELQREVKTQLGAAQEQSVAIRIGAIESVLHSWLIPWIAQLRQEQPALELELTVETTPVLMDQIQRGAQDIVFAALPASGDGVRTKALPAMAMAFVGQDARHTRRQYSLAHLAQEDLLTFQRGSQPYVALLDALRGGACEPKKVHAISSISAMVQLVQGGFGVATLPLAAATPLAGLYGLKILKCDMQLPPLPLHASYRNDPATGLVEIILKSALSFVGTDEKRKTSTKHV
jgi:DNA-binding transcriptional LysR family regulator